MRKWTPFTNWFSELLCIFDDGKPHLSRSGMQNYLYFATAPVKQRLLVSQRKHAIVDGLPVVQPPLPSPCSWALGLVEYFPDLGSLSFNIAADSAHLSVFKCYFAWRSLQGQERSFLTSSVILYITACITSQ